jgi:hypothetical protein
MPGRSSSLSPATSPTIPVRDLPELPDVTASWTWEDLESKQIKPPLKRPSILEAPSMKALMAARRNRTGKTKMEELFTEFKDFNGISSETAFDAQRSPSHAAMPSYAGPDYGLAEEEGGGSPRLSRRAPNWNPSRWSTPRRS